MFILIIKYILKLIIGVIIMGGLFTCVKLADPKVGNGLLVILSSCYELYLSITFFEESDNLNK